MPPMSDIRKCENCRKEFRAYFVGKRPLAKFCGRKCYAEYRSLIARGRSERRDQAKPAEPLTVRVPDKFYRDHDERGCEPFCNPVRRSVRFVWLSLADEGLDELLDDARHYADPDNFGEEYTGLRRSAAATVKAIEAARAAARKA